MQMMVLSGIGFLLVVALMIGFEVADFFKFWVGEGFLVVVTFTVGVGFFETVTLDLDVGVGVGLTKTLEICL